MDSTPLILIDTSYLCHRAFHAFGDQLSDSNKNPTGVLFGIMRDIVEIMEVFETTKLVFLFDIGTSHRCKIYPSYRWKRVKQRTHLTQSDKLLWQSFQEQRIKLREKYLPRLGVKNIFGYEGFEADDLIAAICLDDEYHKEDKVIISRDSDFYQLLSKRVRMWDPHTKKTYTQKSLFKEYGVDPCQWAMVKAIGGCDTDCVKGIEGVAEKTASNYLNGSMGSHTATYEKIHKHMREHKRYDPESLITKNLKLVTIPYPDTPIPEIVENEITRESWKAMCKKYRMRSLVGTFPNLGN